MKRIREENTSLDSKFDFLELITDMQRTIIRHVDVTTQLLLSVTCKYCWHELRKDINHNIRTIFTKDGRFLDYEPYFLHMILAMGGSERQLQWYQHTYGNGSFASYGYFVFRYMCYNADFNTFRSFYILPQTKQFKFAILNVLENGYIQHAEFLLRTRRLKVSILMVIFASAHIETLRWIFPQWKQYSKRRPPYGSMTDDITLLLGCAILGAPVASLDFIYQKILIPNHTAEFYKDMIAEIMVQIGILWMRVDYLQWSEKIYKPITSESYAGFQMTLSLTRQVRIQKDMVANYIPDHCRDHKDEILGRNVIDTIINHLPNQFYNQLNKVNYISMLKEVICFLRDRQIPLSTFILLGAVPTEIHSMLQEMT